jgi:streptogramin lyase
MGLLLLTVVSGVGCVGPRTVERDSSGLSLAERNPPRLSLEGHVVYRHYDAPRRGDDGTTSGGGLPLALALDTAGNAWVLGEFHTQLQSVHSSGSEHATRHIWIPHHSDALPFTNRHGVRTQNSTLGESVVVDGEGRVWLSQGGGHLVRESANHSRVLSYQPESGFFRVYNLPGNRNEAMGLHWDAPRGLVWVAESGMHAELSSGASDDDPRAGALVAFDPETAPHENDFLWDRSLDHLLCSEPTPDPVGCFSRYALPDRALAPAQLVSDASGSIWFTLFWGGAIGRLDPETGEVIVYPLEAGIGTDRRAKAVGPGPWDIAISPDGEHVVWSEFFDSTIARLPLARGLDPACRTLLDGRNPCVEQAPIPGADLGGQRVHSIAFDAFGNLWFTQFAFGVTPTVRNSIGFVTADWSRVELLEPFADQPGGDNSYAGIAIDHRTGDIWVAEFQPPGVGRLTLVNRDVDPATW